MALVGILNIKKLTSKKKNSTYFCLTPITEEYSVLMSVRSQVKFSGKRDVHLCYDSATFKTLVFLLFSGPPPIERTVGAGVFFHLQTWYAPAAMFRTTDIFSLEVSEHSLMQHTRGLMLLVQNRLKSLMCSQELYKIYILEHNQ